MSAPAPIVEIARAKINLTLRVLGRRPDGYHELDSLVTFASAGDRLRYTPGAEPVVTVEGPFASDITGENLVARALRLLAQRHPALRLGAVHLEKNLPVASGIGGGSADAAALLRLVRADNPGAADAVPWTVLARELGADVPVCLAGRPARMGGVGEIVETLAALPALPAVLVNARQPLATADVFRALASGPVKEGAVVAAPLAFPSREALVEYVRVAGNTLETPAIALQPVIGEVKAALAAASGCLVAGMSGSGATCFGIFTDAAAEAAASRLRRDRPAWWVVATELAGIG